MWERKAFHKFGCEHQSRGRKKKNKKNSVIKTLRVCVVTWNSFHPLENILGSIINTINTITPSVLGFSLTDGLWIRPDMLQLSQWGCSNS